MDLAAELTEYADIVERMTQTLQVSSSDPSTSVNFAQAALLIQNSASVSPLIISKHSKSTSLDEVKMLICISVHIISKWSGVKYRSQ